MRSRIEDVAAAAGVSMKTVSRVLNHEPNVREETRQRVMQAVEALQYRPNLSARSLAGQRSYTVALVYNNPSRNYLMEVQGGMLEACRASHYNLVLAPVGAPRLRKAADLRAVFEHFAPDGVVLIPPLTDDATVLEYLEEHEVPFACIAPRHSTGRIGVMMDETAAVIELVRGLIALGHRRIGHIKGPPAHGACLWRYRGYRQALKSGGHRRRARPGRAGKILLRIGHRSRTSPAGHGTPAHGHLCGQRRHGGGLYPCCFPARTSCARRPFHLRIRRHAYRATHPSRPDHGASTDFRDGANGDDGTVGEDPLPPCWPHGAHGARSAVPRVDGATAARTLGPLSDQVHIGHVQDIGGQVSVYAR